VARQADGSLGTNTEPVLAVLPSQGAWTWRAWEEGDWMNPLGMTGKKKVSDLLTDAKVPSFVRKNLFVLAEAIPGGEVLWIPGMRTAQSVAVNAESSSFWKICAHYL
jgi:tRNA(Ile)-lysidine synthase